jgi:hypothetical protein
MKRRLLFLLLFFFALPAVAVRAQLPAQKRTFSPPHCEKAPVVDGQFDDYCWPKQALDGFVQFYPDTGQPAQPDTRVWVAYDDEALYVFAECLDPHPENILARVTRRDRPTDSDAFVVAIDSRLDRRNAQFFRVNAACVQLDGTILDDNQENLDWDGVWESACETGSGGWKVEIKIPLKLLRYNPGPEVSFGVNFLRWSPQYKQYSTWQFMDPKIERIVSQFGELTDMNLPHQPIQFDLVPYIVARPSLPSSASYPKLSAFDAGLDGRVGLGGNFALTFAINPDFGQVEADQQVLNLSTFETYFPEKRPFFLEDMALFRTPTLSGYGGAQQFYTRRIGRAPRDPDLTDDEEIVKAAAPPRIYGAMKLAGETSGRLQLGLLQAVTAEERALVQGPEGEKNKLAEPLSSFSLLRLRQGFLDHSSGGFMLTALTTDGEGSSVVGGGDLVLELFGGDWTLGALGFTSYLTEERFRWQDEYVEKALRTDGPLGYGGQLRLEKTTGKYLVGSANVIYYSPGLAMNDMGYLERADRLLISANIKHHRQEPLGPLARYAINLNGWLDRNNDLVNLGDGFNLVAEVQFKNGWGGGWWLFSGFPFCDDRETHSAGEHVFCYQRHRWKGGLFFWSDSSKWLHGGADISLQNTEQGYGVQISGGLTLEVASRWQIELVPGYFRALGSVRWLDTFEQDKQKRFYFGKMHVENWDFTLRSTLAVFTKLSWQVYAQLFLVSADYGQKYASPWPAPHRFSVSDLVPEPTLGDDYDYSRVSLNLSSVIRWEFLPGSVAYMVYTYSTENDTSRSEFRPGELLDLYGQAPYGQALMLKLLYFWE